MKRPKPLLLAILALGGAILCIAIFRNPPPGPPPPSSTGAVAPHSRPSTGPAASSDLAPIFWARRVGMEALVLTGSGAAVEFLDSTGKVLGSGRLDPAGAFRGAIPAGAGSMSLKYASGTAAVWRLPEPPGPLAGILADRGVLRPGDRLRACLRLAEDAAPPPVLTFDPEDPAVPPPLFAAPEVIQYPEASARWRVYETRIPEDVRPGTAVISSGGGTLEVPIAGRFAPADDGGGGSPDAPPSPPDPGTGGQAAAEGLRLERKDGLWRATGPADTGTVLFYAESGGRILAHQAVVAMDGAASTGLPLGDDPPAKVRVTAIASTPRGFLESFTGSPGPSALAMDDDPVLSRFLAERPLPEAVPSGPAWIHEGDEPAGPDPAPPARQGYLERRGHASVKPGREETVDFPGNAKVRWTVHPPGIHGSVRIRCDGEIRAEARIPSGKDGAELPASDHAIRSLLVESHEPAIESVSFDWTLAGKAGVAPALPGGGVSILRTLPERGRVGDQMEYRIVIRWKEGGRRTEVACPIPRGAVLAEDGWSIRSRAPAGSRVGTPDGAVIYRIPDQNPGEAVLTFRIRLAWPGRFAVPAATANLLQTGPGGGSSGEGLAPYTSSPPVTGTGTTIGIEDSARSAAGFLEIL